MLAQWPLTPNGKVDRAALPEPDQQAVASREYVAPQGAAEQALALLWQELLGLERVGRDDHFFELGGHSLLAMQLALRIKQTCLVELPLAVLFEQATLTTMADHIEKQQFATLLGDDANDLDQFSDEEMLAMLEEGDKQSE
ncbi:phosphopantetheine-binding protein [Rugamonas violacea]